MKRLRLITVIGPTDAECTRSTDNHRYSVAVYLNMAGQVAGNAWRYDGAMWTGESAWLYNGTSTPEIGLTDSVHTRSTDGFQANSSIDRCS